MDLSELVEVSRFYGLGNDFVISGGGNTSVKDAERIAIKASGFPLRGITEAGFVELSRVQLRNIMKKTYSAEPFQREKEIKNDLMACRVDTEKGGRPSVETSLHEMIGFRFVVHTHPSVVNAVTCSKNGEEVARELFGDAALWVPYTDPGYRLAKLMEESLAAYRARHHGDPHVILMQNHGLVVAADTVKEIHALTDEVVRAITARFAAPAPRDEAPVPESVTRVVPILRMLLSGPEGTKIASVRSSALAERFLAPEHRAAVSLPFMPDNIVYCKSAP
ncbi:MAG TPA: class II aldolase/adducin family protein, partial [Spirochaetia bacterium]